MPRHSIHLELDDWSGEEFYALKEQYPSLSEEQLAHIILDYVLGSSAVEAAAFAPFAALAKQDEGGNGNGEENSCKGKCEGEDTKRRLVDGECPSPCDQDILDELTASAKKQARKNAIDHCMEHDADCICAGGTWDIKATCETGSFGDLKMCEYKVKAKYRNGTCQRIA